MITGEIMANRYFSNEFSTLAECLDAYADGRIMAAYENAGRDFQELARLKRLEPQAIQSDGYWSREGSYRAYLHCAALLLAYAASHKKTCAILRDLEGA